MKFRLRGISRNVVTLGWVSFCTDLASEMLYPVFPLFVVATLGWPTWMLGLIEGLAEGISSGLRWLGGALSDRFGRRKPFVFLGYTISAFSKPVMGLGKFFGGAVTFGVGRCADRLGKSLRTSARDALIAESTDEEHRGIAFGFHRMMDTCGAILGPLVTLGIIIALVGTQTTFAANWKEGHANPALRDLPLHWLFFAALIPGLASSFLVTRFVKEILPETHGAGSPPPIFQSFPAPLWKLMIANAVFSVGNSSDTFLLLKSSQLGLGFGHIVLAFALFNVIYALMSTPLGHLSDKIGRKPVIASGWIVYAAVYLGFAAWNSTLAPWILLGTYGLYQAFTEGTSKAMVSDLVPKEKRAGAIGLYYTVAGFGQLIGSLIAGWTWNDSIAGLHAPFAIGSLCALLAVPLVLSVNLPSRQD